MAANYTTRSRAAVAQSVMHAFRSLFALDSGYMRVLAHIGTEFGIQEGKVSHLPLDLVSAHYTLFQIRHVPQLAAYTCFEAISALYVIGSYCRDFKLRKQLLAEIMRIQAEVIRDPEIIVARNLCGAPLPSRAQEQPIQRLGDFVAKYGEQDVGEHGFQLIHGQYKHTTLHVHKVENTIVVCKSADGVTHRIGKQRYVRAV